MFFITSEQQAKQMFLILSWFVVPFQRHLTPGLQSRSRQDPKVFEWSRIPDNTGRRIRIFCPTPTPDVHLDQFYHHIPKLGIPVEMVQFLFETFVETDISCCAMHHDFH